MANRTLGAVDGTSLFACSICGIPARFPGELEYTAERLFRHSDGRHGETTTKLEEARKHGQIPRNQGDAPRFPAGVLADWQAIT
jgi:hypothetical protein